MNNTAMEQTQKKKKGGHKRWIENRHNKFITEFLKDYNGKQAAIRAGYSKRSAESTASLILTYPKVHEEITRRERMLQHRFIATKERILKELALIGFADLSEYVSITEDGELRFIDLTKLPPQTSRALKTVKAKTDSRESSDGETIFKKSRIEVTLHDKIEALLLMGKHLGMFKERHEVTGKDSGPVNVCTLTDAELMAIIMEGRNCEGK